MTRALIIGGVLLALSGGASTQAAPSAADLDSLLAPVALYPDQLLGPMLVCAGNPGKVSALSEWMRSQTAKGSELQAAAAQSGFDDCYVALVLFPDVVHWMESQSAWMSKVGSAFATDRSAVFASIQRLRGKAKAAGTLKSTPQQSVETKTTSGGENVIVIEPANSQIVYVPQYNAQTVYTQPTTSTVVVQQSSSSSDAAVAGVIGFTAGVAMGAMWNNNYYYGPYGYHGGYMYNDAWDDWYDHREDAREDWQDHREDMADEYGDRAKNAQDNRTERRENTQNSRTDRQQNRQENGTGANRTDRQAQRSGTTSSTASAATQSTRSGTQETRGFSGDGRSGSTRSGTGSTAFSGYSSGKSERAASSRGQSSRSSARSSGGSRRR